MTERSAAELEREAEAARARMVETAHSLQHKMTPGQILDQLGSYFRNSDGAVALDNLKTQVRDNPLPLALVGTGLAWLFMGGGPRRLTPRHHVARGDSEPDAAWADATGLPETGTAPIPASAQDHPSSMTERAGSAFRSVSQAAGSLSGKVGSAYTSAGETLSSAAHSVTEGGHRASSRTGEAAHYAQHAGGRAQSMIRDTLQQDPLIIGALGIAFGAALGAMLPRTQAEDEYLGPYEDQMRENLKETARHGMDSAKDVASHAYQAGKEEAERQSHGRQETAPSKSADTAAAKTAESKASSPTSKNTS